MHVQQIDPDSPVGHIVATAPLTARVFTRHGIDYCCGGGAPLTAACNSKGLDVEHVLAELHAELDTAEAQPNRWLDAPLGELIDHILEAYHRPLDEELPRLEAMARKVHSVHGPKDPDRLRAISRLCSELRAELEPHMRKEEVILFPMIRSGQGAMAQGPVHVMMLEHDQAGALLERLRELTDGYTVPAGACNTWTALWHGLADLERSLHEHIHLENNILFPRALGT